MALGSTQQLTEMSTRNLPGGKRRPKLKADTFTANCKSIVYKMWEPRRLTTLWASRACYRVKFTYNICAHLLIFAIMNILGSLFSAVKKKNI
jgi:hypothetical protein